MQKPDVDIFKILLTILTITVGILGFCLAAHARDFYVSSFGTDSADGLTFENNRQLNSGPFKTLNRAQQAIRDLKKTGQFREAVTVHIAPGAYQLTTPLDFDIRDSGFADRKIIWKGENGPVDINGGISLLRCQPGQTRIWNCPVADLRLDKIPYIGSWRKKGNAPGFNLYLNQQRLHLARWPDNEWAHIKSPLDEKTSFSVLEHLPDLATGLSSAQVHIFAGNDWLDEYLRVLAIDQGANELKLSNQTAYPLVRGRRFYLENMQTQLDAPGEWFFDIPNAGIQFIPPENMVPEKIVVSSLKNLLSLRNANFIRFEHFGLQYGAGDAITIENSDNVALDNLEIHNIDGTAIKAENSTNLHVSNSDIHDLGEAGVLIGGGDRIALQSSGNIVHNNHIYNLGRTVMTYTPAVGVKGVGAHVTHNLLEHVNGAAIFIDGNDHSVEFNEISHACEQAADCGAIYSGRNWTYRGNAIRFNHIHDINGYELQRADVEHNLVKYGHSGAVGVYLDDGVSGFEISGNLFNKAGGMAIQLGGGRDNHIENNVFYSENIAILTDNRWPEYDWSANRKSLAEAPYQSGIWKTRYPELAMPMENPTWPEGNAIRRNVIVTTKANGASLRYCLPSRDNIISDNLVWGTNGDIRVSYNILDRIYKQDDASWQDWMSLGFEKNSIKADPCLTLTGNRAIFCGNSPIRKIGFQAIPDGIGLIMQ